MDALRSRNKCDDIEVTLNNTYLTNYMHYCFWWTILETGWVQLEVQIRQVFVWLDSFGIVDWEHWWQHWKKDHKTFCQSKFDQSKSLRKGYFLDFLLFVWQKSVTRKWRLMFGSKGYIANQPYMSVCGLHFPMLLFYQCPTYRIWTQNFFDNFTLNPSPFTTPTPYPSSIIHTSLYTH